MIPAPSPGPRHVQAVWDCVVQSPGTVRRRVRGSGMLRAGLKCQARRGRLKRARCSSGSFTGRGRSEAIVLPLIEPLWPRGAVLHNLPPPPPPRSPSSLTITRGAALFRWPNGNVRFFCDSKKDDGGWVEEGSAQVTLPFLSRYLRFWGSMDVSAV